MNKFFKSLGLGVSLVLTNRLCLLLFSSLPEDALIFASGIVFFIVATLFLVSENISDLLLCGFCGMFFMFFFEIFFGINLLPASESWFSAYWGGLFGSFFALCLSLVLTVKNISLKSIFKEKEIIMEKDLKIKLLLYMLISAMSFSYLVMPERAGISIPIFIIIQFVCLLFIVPDKKRLLWFIPISILSLNYFLYSNTLWYISNTIVIAVLYSCMFEKFKLYDTSLKFLKSVISRVLDTFTYIALPAKWTLELTDNKASAIKRIIIAFSITLPCALILTLVLSNADMVFSMKADSFFNNIFRHFKFHSVYIIFFGIIAGLYLFGVVYSSFCTRIPVGTKEFSIKADLIIINILLVSVLFVYTLFVIVQFKYLFAGAVLPEGLTYTEYARKGFFELLWLTVVNISIILIIMKITSDLSGSKSLFIKILCCYLCLITIVLLISSFYRMYLYTSDDGLTRLRFLVMGFLIFEAFGLLVTLYYIIKPKFNITLIYLLIALFYYMVLNIIPIDSIIAKNQITKFKNGEQDGLSYVFTLSPDAVPEIYEFSSKNSNPDLQEEINTYFNETKAESERIPKRWQRYNLSFAKALELIEK